MLSRKIPIPSIRAWPSRHGLRARSINEFRRYASAHNSVKLEGAADNAFNRERKAVKDHALQSADLWRKLCIYVVVPALLLASVNAKNLWDEHWEHWSHELPLEERPQYAYLNIRTKSFPFGDGDKTLFWNPKVNYYNKDGN